MDSSVEPECSPGAVFFDLDNTLIARSSTLAFGRPFYRSGLISRSDVVRGLLAQFIFKLGGADHRQMERIRAHVSSLCRGWPADKVRGIVVANLERLVLPYVYPQALGLLQTHKAAGRDVVIVSASGREIVEPVGELLGADHVIATRMVIADGLYTGDFELYAYGTEKEAAVRRFAADRGYPLGDCFAYSDSITDLPMLEAVGHPYVVNPDRALRATATVRGWPVLAFALGSPPHGPERVPGELSRGAGVRM